MNEWNSIGLQMRNSYKPNTKTISLITWTGFLFGNEKYLIQFWTIFLYPS